MAAPRSRREFLRRGLAAGAVVATGPLPRAFAQSAPGSLSDLRTLYPDLERHFVLEYYPWYGGPPDYEHWDYLGRHPPLDLATRYVPKLGPYDVRSVSTLEQHATWIREAGIGAVALSWWGRNSWENRAVSLVLDVLKAHDLKATFALEPYTDARARYYASDVLYLLREYGEKRHWDAFLLLRNADGRVGPVFKSFRTILPEASTDCLGESHPVSDYTPDVSWRSQTDALRDALKADFDHVTLLADSLAFPRAADAGFSGIGTYDNFIPPEDYRGYAEGASRAGLVFSFHVNPGYDQIEPRPQPSDPCYAPRAFAPPTPGLDFTTAAGLERAEQASLGRIRSSWNTALSLQLDPQLANARAGFLLVYVNSWNEWHEGHAFEPMKDAAELTPDERALGYRNPANGSYRLQALAELQRQVLAPPPPSPRRGGPSTRSEPGPPTARAS
jgi:glycosyl hydrolase family 99